MSSLSSPGVEIKEIDASVVTPTAGGVTAAFGGFFTRGPGLTSKLITNNVEYIDTFGEPTNTNYNDWFQGYNYLQYSNSLLVSRVIDTSVGERVLKTSTIDSVAFPAIGDTIVKVSDGTDFMVGEKVVFGADTNVYTIEGISANDLTVNPAIITDGAILVDAPVEQVKYSTNSIADVDNGVAAVYDAYASVKTIANDAEFDYVDGTIAADANTALKFIARNPGTWGNNLKVFVAVPADFGAGKNLGTGVYAYPIEGLFDFAPTGSEIAVIVTEDTSGEVLEKYLVSTDSQAKDFNSKSIFVESVINNNSSFVFVQYYDAAPASTIDTVNGTDFMYGQNGVTGQGQITDAYEVFSNKEEIDVDIVIGNETNPQAASNISEYRKDCIAFVGAPLSIVGQSAADAVDFLVNPSTGYVMTGDFSVDSDFASFYGNVKLQYDKFNDKKRWINVAGDAAGIRARTSIEQDPWFPSAGIDRGQIKNVIKLSYNPNQSLRDQLYKNKVNPVVTFPGQGTIVWGQKTCQSKPSAFDRVNVRNLFNYAERNIANMSKYMVFEFNDDFTRNRFKSAVIPFLNRIQGARGIEEFLVICDETNNTGAVISNNQFIADILIKPAYSAEFLTLRFTAVGAGVEFSEITG